MPGRDVSSWDRAWHTTERAAGEDGKTTTGGAGPGWSGYVSSPKHPYVEKPFDRLARLCRHLDVDAGRAQAQTGKTRTAALKRIRGWLVKITEALDALDGKQAPK